MTVGCCVPLHRQTPCSVSNPHSPSSSRPSWLLQTQQRQESYGIKPSPSFADSFTDEATSQPRTATLPVQQQAVAQGSDPLSQVRTAFACLCQSYSTIQCDCRP